MQTHLTKIRAAAAAAAALFTLSACSDTPAGTFAPEEPAPSPAIATSGYSAVVGDDWKAYASKAELRAAGGFWWNRSEDVYQYVNLVRDPLFGQVVRTTFQQSDQTGFAPRMDKNFSQPLDRAWYRWRMKYSPGWTTAGPNPAGHANSYKVAFWLWDGYQGRGQVEISNTDQYIIGFGVNANGSYLKYAETPLAGSAASFGRVTTEWSDNEWWEFVVYYEKTGATTARQHWWRRRLTNGGQVANNPWTYVGVGLSGATTPRVRGISLGANKNKSNPSTMHIDWGPWEVVDGARFPNPFGMPNVSGSAPAPSPTPTLSAVRVSPDTATVAAGATRQFAATGTYSDGTSRALAVAWSATGGTVSSTGLYTAPATAGSYRVIGREATTGRADTSTVTVPAAAVTLQQVILSPGTASVPTGGTVQFSAQGRYSDGTTRAIAAAYATTGGTVTAAGLYTAGQTAGGFRVVARDAATGRADTSTVTVTAPTTTAPPAAGSYALLAGDSWKSYTSKTALSPYYSSADLANVDLVADPVFGQVVRLTQRAGSTASPRLQKTLPSAQNRVWYRWRVKFTPGWSTGGSAWTMAQWSWSGHNGVASTGFSGTNHALAFNVRDAQWRYLSYGESVLPGSRSWGGVGTEFTDGQWYEYVMLWEKTGATTGRAHWWTRRLTNGGQVANNAWTYYGIALSGSTTPQVGAVALGAGNLGRAPSSTQSLLLGPWEVVDGTRFANPFGMTGF